MVGLEDSLDYLYGMGIRGLYVAGSLLYNEPWASDSYSPLVSANVNITISTHR